MLIMIDLREKHGNLVFLLIFLKLLIFRLVITYFGTPQIASDHTIFVKKFAGGEGGLWGMPPDPPSNSVTTQCNGATYTPAMELSF